MADYVDEHFEWDLNKSAEILARHGFDFHVVAEIFEKQNYINAGTDCSDEGEERMNAVGRTRGMFITAVYTMRGDRKRIITAWKSERWEIDEYVRHMGYRDEGKN
jgi:uncharacterized DUF497 family protein